MENFNNDLLGLSAAAIVAILILRMVFDFVQKMKANGKAAKDESTAYVGFGETHAQCLKKIEYQVNEIYTGLQVSKELQTAIASVLNMQEQQTAILNQLTELTATSQKLLERMIGNEK